MFFYYFKLLKQTNILGLGFFYLNGLQFVGYLKNVFYFNDFFNSWQGNISILYYLFYKLYGSDISIFEKPDLRILI